MTTNCTPCSKTRTDPGDISWQRGGMIEVFVIQQKSPPWAKKWTTLPTRYPDIEAALLAFNKIPFKEAHRIAEEYTVVRYKPVKITQ